MWCQERFSEEFKIFDHAHQTSTTGAISIQTRLRRVLSRGIGMMVGLPCLQSKNPDKHTMQDIRYDNEWIPLLLVNTT